MQTISVAQFGQYLKAEDLGAGSIFGALSTDATGFLLQRGVIHRVEKGDVIFRYGDPGHSFFVVCAGSIDFYKESEQRESVLTRSIGFGEEVGFVALIALHDHAGTAVAREDGLLLEISSDLFSELHQAFPLDFGLLVLNLARDMARVISKLGDKLVAESTQHALRHPPQHSMTH